MTCTECPASLVCLGCSTALYRCRECQRLMHLVLGEKRRLIFVVRACVRRPLSDASSQLIGEERSCPCCQPIYWRVRRFTVQDFSHDL